VGRAIPVRRVRFPSTSANPDMAWPARSHRATRVGSRLRRMVKKLLLLLALGGLLAIAAKKLRTA